MSRVDTLTRWLSHVDKNGPIASNHPELGRCWLWVGLIADDGYGRMRSGQSKRVAHRWGYEMLVGPVPVGLDLDHFACDLRACVNPAHLRPVTRRENLLRGNTIPARNLAKTHCPAGHPYDEVNTSVSAAGRTCRACAREAMRRKYVPVGER